MENADITQKINNGDLFVLTREEMALILPWLRNTLATQERQDENADLCQLFSKIMRLSNRLYGTEPFNRETCICNG
ncbi:hypothetical protein [Streptomyces prunicolor]|uniref:hypothetical protein n=1 Tax=Streptomyces prunicolor TaxID=67348 RepID=UPI00037783D2|nr:hypothetical protein [Streptomyces prunicolor]